MAEIKYGWVRGGRTGAEYPCAADQYFHRLGGHFVYADSYGRMTVVATPVSTILGWAETPKDASGYSSWKSSSTAGESKVYVITDPTAVYAMPVSEGTASLATTMIGDCADLVISGSTYTAKQLLNLGVDNRDYLRIEEVDTANKIAYVRINYAKFQADT